MRNHQQNQQAHIVWTMTPLTAHQLACQRPCPRTAPVNLHITVLWSMPVMMTGILGLRQPRGAQREGHRQIRANQALHVPRNTFWSIPAMMPSITSLKIGKKTQREVHHVRGRHGEENHERDQDRRLIRTRFLLFLFLFTFFFLTSSFATYHLTASCSTRESESHV